MAVPAAPVRVPSQRPLAPSVASVTSVASDKGDNEMILGAVHDLLAFALQLLIFHTYEHADPSANMKI